MIKLKISSDIALPIEFVTSTQAIIAKKRVGKSYKAAVQAEELLENGQQVVIIDPTSAHWGLRSSADGKSSGYSIVIFGGAHGDLPLDPAAGEVIADAIIAHGFSAILDLKELTKGEEQRFAAAFLERLYRKNEKPLHLFIDEADVYAPQRPFGVDEAKTLGACQSIVRRGGIKGIGCTMITQRAAVLNKDVLSQVDMLTVLRMNHPKDIGAIDDWVAVHADPKQAKAMVDSLPNLPKGDAWVWAPEHDIFKRITFRDRKTFDSGATPKPGQTKREPKKLAPVEIAKLGEAISSMAERHKQDDPKHLRSKIAELIKDRDQLSRTVNSKQSKVETKTAAKPVISEAHLEKLERVIAKADDLKANWNQAIERARDAFESAIAKAKAHADRVSLETGILRDILKATRPVPTRPVTGVHRADERTHAHRTRLREVAEPREGDPPCTGALRRIMVALAQHPDGLTDRKIGVFSGVSTKGGSFGTYLSRARSAGWIENNRGSVRRITEAGLAAVGDYDPLPTGPALATFWMKELGGSMSRILSVLIDAYPEGLDDETIGERAEVSTKGGSFGTYLSRLRSRDLLEDLGGRTRKASDALFEGPGR